MRRLLAAGLLALASASIAGQAPASQAASAQARLDAVIERMIGRGGRSSGAGTGAADPSALLAELRAIDAPLPPASDIDRRFAESILVGRQLASERRDGPMGDAAYTRMLREQFLLAAPPVAQRPRHL